MSLTSTAPSVRGADVAPAHDVRRVRHQARDVVLLMTFSALTSTLLAGVLLVLAHLTAAAGR